MENWVSLLFPFKTGPRKNILKAHEQTTIAETSAAGCIEKSLLDFSKYTVRFSTCGRYQLSRAKYSCEKSGPMNLLSRTLSRCFRDPMFCFRGLCFLWNCFRDAFAADCHTACRLSRVFRGGTFFGYFRDKLSPAFAACVLAFAGFYRTPLFTTLYCQGLWRCSIEVLNRFPKLQS